MDKEGDTDYLPYLLGVSISSLHIGPGQDGQGHRGVHWGLHGVRGDGVCAAPADQEHVSLEQDSLDTVLSSYTSPA